MTNIENHINLLGLKVRDKVTGYQGVVVSVCFDLYGCIQAAINPGLDEKGQPQSSNWYDVSRLAVTDKEPVMPVPYFTPEEPDPAKGQKGPAEKMQPGKP